MFTAKALELLYAHQTDVTWTHTALLFMLDEEQVTAIVIGSLVTVQRLINLPEALLH
jgi:hypothetical protein